MTRWRATVHISGSEGLGELHDDESLVIAELADLGGSVSRVQNHYLARLLVQAPSEEAARRQIENGLSQVLRRYEWVRAIIVQLEEDEPRLSGGHR